MAPPNPLGGAAFQGTNQLASFATGLPTPMPSYHPAAIEPRWQDYWLKNKTFNRKYGLFSDYKNSKIKIEIYSLYFYQYLFYRLILLAESPSTVILTVIEGIVKSTAVFDAEIQ